MIGGIFSSHPLREVFLLRETPAPDAILRTRGPKPALHPDMAACPFSVKGNQNRPEKGEEMKNRPGAALQEGRTRRGQKEK
jgi:hypothetical protein